jgi:EAL domain-containing protein (putative c-di-GMP-specific phosphodiesterase class I)
MHLDGFLLMNPSFSDSQQWPMELADTPKFWLAYQPIVRINAKPNTVLAFESLLRVQIDGVAHGPADIVAAAESDGSIISIDRWVMNEAIRQAIARPHLNVWINASQISIAHPNFLKDALRALTASGTLGRMTFEITETADVDAAVLAERLSAVKAGTLSLVIDDVRDGFAKRSLLKNSAVAGCKLSRDTTSELHVSERVRAEVQRLVKLCRLTGKRVVLEGVENAYDLKMATNLGIEYCQGYHFGHPTEPENLQCFSEMRLAE